MAFEVGKLYFVNLQYPSCSNNPSPAKGSCTLSICSIPVAPPLSSVPLRRGGSATEESGGGTGGVGRGTGKSGGVPDAKRGSEGKEGIIEPGSSQNPVDPKTGLTYSARMKKAMLQEWQRAMQVQIVEGDLEVEGDLSPLLCILSPLTKVALQGLSSKDSFPYELLSQEAILPGALLH